MLFIVLACPGALAQAPWVVKVTPLMNPLPVGYCAAVQLSILDASAKEIPRNPQGLRITLADFDMAVASPDAGAVVGQQVDAYHWSVCGCQGAAPGTTATITASYPARALSASARVPNASIQATASIVLAAPKGGINPPACKAVERSATAAAATPASQPARSGVVAPPVSPPVTITPTPAPSTPTAVGEALPRNAGATRVAPYTPGPVTVSFELNANGSWYEPHPESLSFDLNASGSWYEPAPVIHTFDLTATGAWIERTQSPDRPIQPAPPAR